MLKNKIIVRKIRNIVILIMAMAVMVGAYRYIDRSRAEKVVEIGAIALDDYGYLEDEEITLEAKQVENDLYEVELPDSINTKKINRIVKIGLGEFSETEDASTGNATATDTTTDANAATNTEDAETQENATEIILEDNLELVENRIYLTKEQVENQEEKINIEVEYDTKTTEEDETLYNKILRYEDEANNKLVELKGYLPVDAEIQVEEVSQEKLKEILGEEKLSKLGVAYDIKIIQKVVTQVPADEADPNAQPEEIVEIVEINPEDFGETCEVSITDANIAEKSQVYHVNEDNTVEQVNVKDNSTEGNVSFEAQTFSIYFTLSEDLAAEEGTLTEPGDGTEITVPGDVVVGATEDTLEIVTDGLIRNFEASKNTGNGYSSSTTTWQDLSGNHNGRLSGGNWSDEYLTLDGTNDWVSLGSISIPNTVTFEITIEINEVQPEEVIVLSNAHNGGCEIGLIDGKPIFYVHINGYYREIVSNEVLTVGKKYHLLGTYDGQKMKLYVNGELKAENAISGSITPTEFDTVLAIGVDPYKDEPHGEDNHPGWANINVYSARAYDIALTQEQVTNNMLVSLKDNTKPEIFFSTDVALDGLIREFDAYNNTGDGHSNSVTTWKDLTLTNDGTITGGTWSEQYIKLDGKDDWVNLGQVPLTNEVTLEATIEVNKIQSGERTILANYEYGGVGLYLYDRLPYF